jgi:tRNA G18 (ribose-2'-O)-methylase SpoU
VAGVEVTRIEDPDDPRYLQFRLNERGLANRSDKRDDAGAGMFLAEGDLVVERALAAGCRPIAALVDVDHVPQVAERLDCPVYGGGSDVRRVVSQLGVPLSIITLFHRPARPSVARLASTAHRLVIVEAVDNPANIGSIIRNAAALGWDGLILDHTSADPLARRSLRVAMGTVFSLPHARTTELAAELRALTDIELYAMTPDPGAAPIGSITPGEHIGIMIGSERSGLSAELLELATPVRIPMAPGIDSLNAAAATAIACFALGPDLARGAGSTIP